MPRFFNLPDSEKLRNLKAQHMAQFVQIRANVVRATDVRPKVLSMEFTCTKCGEPMLEKFSEGRYVTPARCTGTVGPGGNPCKSRTFEPSRSSARIQLLVGKYPLPYASNSGKNKRLRGSERSQAKKRVVMENEKGLKLILSGEKKREAALMKGTKTFWKKDQYGDYVYFDARNALCF